MTRAAIAALTMAFAASLAATPQLDRFTYEFTLERPGEAVPLIRAGCARCDWGEAGREAAVLRVAVDGKYSQHLVLFRGEAPADYRVRLGPLPAGRHVIQIERDAELSAKDAGPASIDVLGVAELTDGQDAAAKAMAPIVYARPNTVGKFTDVPLVMWYEIVPTKEGRQFRYSVIFSNEDGGTQTDRLMATWGRTTDIEFIYGVTVDRTGKVVAEEFQGPGHEVPPFTGQHEGRHPLLWVSTDNNMVSESGPTRIRYAPDAELFDLRSDSREAVMDANPWTYAVASVEMRREGKIAGDPPPGINQIPDPRRFAFVEACGTIGNAALSLSIGTVPAPSNGRARLPPSRQASADHHSLGDGGQPDRDLVWTASDRGLPQYRIVRDGCFTIATPLPSGTRPSDIRALRVHAFARPPAEGKAAVAPNPVRLSRINKLFMLDEHDLPGASILKWQGQATIRAGGDPFEVKVP